MDISDVTKEANRKRMFNDAEKLREKVSREKTQVIKIKVAQDAAYWDLQEKLQQLEVNHERLQQNMVEVQMQHEAVSGQYQEELRLRPDTLNKLSATREICDVLEEHGLRLQRNLTRYRADQQALAVAYDVCGKRVHHLKEEAQQAHAQLTSERNAARLAAASHEAQARQLVVALNQLAEESARTVALTIDLRRCEETAATLGAEASRAALELDNCKRELAEQRAEAQAVAQAADEAQAAARAARAHQEVETARADALERELAQARMEADATINRIKTDFSSEMEKTMDERKQLVSSLETQMQAMKEQLEALQAAASAAHEQHNTQRKVDAEKIQELLAKVAERERELDGNTESVARLMADLRSEAQARYRAEDALEGARRAHEVALQGKEQELGAQLVIIQDIRNEKASLQERVDSMLATIENARNTMVATAPPPLPQRQPAERDLPPGDELLYSFLSDGSMENERDTQVRAAAARGTKLRLEDLPPLSLSQIRNDFKMKKRQFFKNKRPEQMSKRFKE